MEPVPGEPFENQGMAGPQLLAHGRSYLFFGGCNYLGLAQSDEVIAAGVAALVRHGAGVGASRRTTGTLGLHRRLETALARFKGEEAACLLPAGLLGPRAVLEAEGAHGDVHLIDAAAHPASWAALPRDARVLTFRHYDPADLATKASMVPSSSRLVLLIDAVDLEGEIAPLHDLAAALVGRDHLAIIDDAHGLGTLGPHGRGILEELGTVGLEAVETDTLAKALGSYGGFVAASESTCARIRERSGVFGASTALPPAAVASALAALAILVERPQLVSWLRTLAARAVRGLAGLGFSVRDRGTPIITAPEWTHGNAEALHAALLEDGVFVPVVRYPGAADPPKLRVVLSAAHSTADVDALIAAFARHG